MLSDAFGNPLLPKKPRGVKAVSAEPDELLRARRALLRRAKASERKLAKWQIKHDGPDPKYRGLTTSTGRIGHVTNIQADTLSAHYLGENKNEVVPIKWLRYWQKINDKATEWGKDALLCFEPSNRDLVSVRLPDIHWITPDRHAELLRKEQEYDYTKATKNWSPSAP